MLNRLFLALVFVALPSLALAHPGPHAHPHAETALQPLIALEHLIPLAGVAFAAALAYRWVRARGR
ncbi:MAG: hypothetical protein Tsb0020_48660 [Haliangiales bacterium]